ncbi:MAG: response regulator [Candidatus Moranbacteria bacterium]|nr:response regulator [Candidatus Moranbacteria bacterium]
MKKKKTILLIEDDAYQVSMYATNLKNNGFSVLHAKNQQEALQMAKKQKPDLILLDLLLGEDNGVKILKKLKKDPQTKNLKVVILSNYKEHSLITECLQQGAIDYLVKDELEINGFCEKIKSYLG